MPENDWMPYWRTLEIDAAVGRCGPVACLCDSLLCRLVWTEGSRGKWRGSIQELRKHYREVYGQSPNHRTIKAALDRLQQAGRLQLETYRSVTTFQICSGDHHGK